jgi:hypothetical protein
MDAEESTKQTTLEDSAKHPEDFLAEHIVAKTHSKLLLQWTSILAATVTLAGAAATFFIAKSGSDSQAIVTKGELRASKAEMQISIDGLNARLDEMTKQIQDVGKNLPEQSVVALKLKALNQSVGKYEKRLAAMEGVILDNPQKALALPLMKKDIDSLKETRQTDTAASRQEIDRVYDQTKWFIGLMITSAIGIIALAISSFYTKR